MEALNEVLGSQQHIYLGLLAAQILPMIVGLVTDETAGTTQTWLLIALSAATAVVDEAVAAGAWEWGDAGLRFVTLFFAAVISYKGWQKRTIAPVVQLRGGNLSFLDKPLTPQQRAA